MEVLLQEILAAEIPPIDGTQAQMRGKFMFYLDRGHEITSNSDRSWQRLVLAQTSLVWGKVVMLGRGDSRSSLRSFPVLRRDGPELHHCPGQDPGGIVAWADPAIGVSTSVVEKVVAHYGV